MPHIPKLNRIMRPFAATTASILLLTVAAACGVVPTATPPVPPANTPPPTTSAPVTPTIEATATTEAEPPTATSTSAPTATATETSTPTPAATATEVPMPSYTWTPVGLAGTYVRDLAIVPGGNNIVLAASSDGLWRSSYNYGIWDKFNVPPPGNPPPGNAEIATGGPDLFFLARHTGCASGLPMVSYRTTDGGQTWLDMNVQITSIQAASGGVVYATTCHAVIKSTDSGATWSAELPGSEFTNSDPYTIAVSPDGQSIYVAYASEGGVVHLKRSTDGGTAWDDITPANAPDNELRALAYILFEPGSVGNPQDGGLYMANSQGTWFLPTESNDWEIKLATGDPASYYVTAFAVDTVYSAEYNKPGPILYEARAQFGEQGPVGLGVFRSTNLGATWQRVGDDLGQRQVTGLALAPHDTAATPDMVETLLAATNDGMFAVPMPPPFR
ncbi:MAG: hypothetical protein ABI670_20670 [Chloroflexota bacterium]